MSTSHQRGEGAFGRTTLRAAAAIALSSSWLVLLFTGWIAGGAVHLLFVAALALFPWRAALDPGAVGRANEEETP